MACKRSSQKILKTLHSTSQNLTINSNTGTITFAQHALQRWTRACKGTLNKLISEVKSLPRTPVIAIHNGV